MMFDGIHQVLASLTPPPAGFDFPPHEQAILFLEKHE